MPLRGRRRRGGPWLCLIGVFDEVDTRWGGSAYLVVML